VLIYHRVDHIYALQNREVDGRQNASLNRTENPCILIQPFQITGSFFFPTLFRPQANPFFYLSSYLLSGYYHSLSRCSGFSFRGRSNTFWSFFFCFLGEGWGELEKYWACRPGFFFFSYLSNDFTLEVRGLLSVSLSRESVGCKFHRDMRRSPLRLPTLYTRQRGGVHLTPRGWGDGERAGGTDHRGNTLLRPG
jgi:hypothetical protein